MATAEFGTPGFDFWPAKRSPVVGYVLRRHFSHEMRSQFISGDARLMGIVKVQRFVIDTWIKK